MMGRRFLAAELEHVEGDGDVVQRAQGLLDQLVHLGVGGQMHHQVQRLRPVIAADAAREARGRLAQILQQGGYARRPTIGADVDAEDLVAQRQQMQAEVAADLSARAGDEYAHGRSCPASPFTITRAAPGGQPPLARAAAPALHFAALCA